ncbi:hypothetical protein B6F84_06200 [Acidianus manzaensis]|uniref:Uncharacterized protein n=2 Tax=Acidianus manzaensis TaxID=282676 RepID=A0A1W6JZM9_9CREN|nr:hypothetical protein B6F84_06200 [Acidianus manzaensis]
MIILGLIITLAIALTILITMPVNFNIKSNINSSKAIFYQKNFSELNMNFNSDMNVRYYYPAIYNYNIMYSYAYIDESPQNYSVNNFKIIPDPIIINSTQHNIQINIVVCYSNITNLSIPQSPWYFTIVSINEKITGNNIFFSFELRLHHEIPNSTLIIPVEYNNEEEYLIIIIR